MILLTKPLAAREIRLRRTMLFEYDIHAPSKHVGNEKIVAIVAVRQHDIAFIETAPELPKQTVLTRSLALI